MVVLVIGLSKFSTNQKHYPDLGSQYPDLGSQIWVPRFDASPVWNFCARISDVISRTNQRGSVRKCLLFSQAIPIYLFIYCIFHLSGGQCNHQRELKLVGCRSTVEPRNNPRNWQIYFCYNEVSLYRRSFSYLFYNWGKEKCLFYRGLRLEECSLYRGSTLLCESRELYCSCSFVLLSYLVLRRI